MPVAHCAAGRLWRTSAVVEATTDRNTAPNSKPETSVTGHAALSTGSKVATPSRALSTACGWPPRKRSSRPAQSRDEATQATPSKA